MSQGVYQRIWHKPEQLGPPLWFLGSEIGEYTHHNAEEIGALGS